MLLASTLGHSVLPSLTSAEIARDLETAAAWLSSNRMPPSSATARPALARIPSR